MLALPPLCLLKVDSVLCLSSLCKWRRTTLPVFWSSHCRPLKSMSWMPGGLSLVNICSSRVLFLLHGMRRSWNRKSDADISEVITILLVSGSLHQISSRPRSCPYQAVTEEAFLGPSLAQCHFYYYFILKYMALTAQELVCIFCILPTLLWSLPRWSPAMGRVGFQGLHHEGSNLLWHHHPFPPLLCT